MARTQVFSNSRSWPRILDEACSPCEYRANVVLYRQGQQVERLYLVDAGVAIVSAENRPPAAKSLLALRDLAGS